MTDIKFMDLSQNDNPAITDSILIGNSTDGLKRTSAGNIAKLAPTDNLFHFEIVTGNNDPTKPDLGGCARVDIAAPDVPGYKFAFWLNPASDGNILPTYIDFPSSQQAILWIGFMSMQEVIATKVRATAVYVKSPTIG